MDEDKKSAVCSFLESLGFGGCNITAAIHALEGKPLMCNWNFERIPDSPSHDLMMHFKEDGSTFQLFAPNARNKDGMITLNTFGGDWAKWMQQKFEKTKESE